MSRPAIFRYNSREEERDLHWALSSRRRALLRSSQEMSIEEWNRHEYQTRVRTLFARAFDRIKIDMESTMAGRALLAWRATREIARMKGLLQLGEPVSMLQDDGEDIWTIPRQTMFSTSGSRPSIHSYAAHKLIVGAEHSLDGFGHVIFPEDPEDPLTEVHGISLTPPPIPLAFRDPRGNPLPSYSPHEDPTLKRWVSILEAIFDAMALPEEVEFLPYPLYESKKWLISLDTARVAWPSRFTIMAMEAFIADDAVGLIIEEPMRIARETLRTKWGLTPYEINTIIKIARHEALEIVQAAPEEARTQMVMKLEDVIRRAKQNLDLRAEITALKNLAVVQGITRIDPDDVEKDIIEFVRMASKHRGEMRAGERLALSQNIEEAIDVQARVISQDIQGA